jgi:abortive infection bacteriophage resistance protein
MRNSAGIFLLKRRRPVVRYDKEPLPLEAQADRLLARGLIAERADLIRRLQTVNYYRLSGYLYHYRSGNGEAFRHGTSLEMIWRRYNFDRRLRILLLDAIERIEVAVRTRFVYYFVMKHGAFGHLQDGNLPNLKMRKHRPGLRQKLLRLLRLKRWTPCPHTEWLVKLRKEKSRSSEAFVKTFEEKYGDVHEHLPLWMACELMTCETTMQFAYGMEAALFKQVAADFGFADEQLRSWIKAIFSLRNLCAHHARLLNRVVGVKPAIPAKKREPLWRQAPLFAYDRVGILLTICSIWLRKITHTTRWRQRVIDLFSDYPDINPADLGMPTAWQDHPLWNN